MINIDYECTEAIIFDVDGTLVDSMGIWKAIDIEFFEMHGKVLPRDLQRQIEGMSFYQTAEYFKDKFGFSEDIDEMIDIWNKMAYKKYSEEIQYKRGAEDFLIFCKNKGIKLGIATSNSRVLFDAVGEHLGINKFMDCIVTGSEVLNGKPAPDVYLEVAKRLNVIPSKCLVFEDITKGILAGKNAGMKVCAIYDEYSSECTEEKKLLADYFINDYTELLKNE